MCVKTDGTFQTLSFTVYGILSHIVLCVVMGLAKTVLEDNILKQIKTFKKSSFMEKCWRNSVTHNLCTVKDTIMKSKSLSRTKHC